MNEWNAFSIKIFYWILNLSKARCSYNPRKSTGCSLLHYALLFLLILSSSSFSFIFFSWTIEFKYENYFRYFYQFHLLVVKSFLKYFYLSSHAHSIRMNWKDVPRKNRYLEKDWEQFRRGERGKERKNVSFIAICKYMNFCWYFVHFHALSSLYFRFFFYYCVNYYCCFHDFSNGIRERMRDRKKNRKNKNKKKQLWSKQCIRIPFITVAKVFYL